MSSERDYRIDNPRIEAGGAPVPGGDPAGSDARDEPEFEAIEAEVRRMETEGPAAVRWGNVSQNALALIQTRSKDMLVSAWLVYALYQTESYRGLAVGLAIFRDMIEVHWEGLQPPLKRERGRVAAAEWLVGRLAAPVGASEPGEADAEAVAAAAQALEDIDRILADKLTREQAALGELVRALRPHAEAARRTIEAAETAAQAPEPAEPAPAGESVPEQAAAPAPASQPAPPPPAPKPAVTAPSVEVPADLGSGDADRAVAQIDTAMRKVASALRAANPADPRAYLYVRAANWFALTQAPPHQGGKTMVPPPAAERLAGIEAMRGSQQHQEALAAAESVAASAPFWLDGQRIVAQSLGALGGAFEPARLAVVGLTAAIAMRLPQLLELRFSDDTPFADDATRRWLAEAAPGGEGAPAATNGAGGDEELDAVIAEARALAGGGKARAGLDRLGAALRAVSSGRERFAWQAGQAEFCLENGFVAAAVSLVDHLDETVERLGLESWEPSLAARAAELRYRTFRHAEAEKIVGAERRRLALEASLGRLARIDVAAAAGLPH